MNRIDLNGRHAVVTGGARGFGRAISERLLDSGATVMLWDLDGVALKEAAAALGSRGRVHTMIVDVAREESVDAATAATLEALGHVDILVNNAGIAGPTVKTVDYPPADFRRVIDVDLVSVFLVSRAFVPHMVSRRYGRITNIASIAGKEGNPNASAYSAAKAGVIGFTKSLGKELAQAGVLVNCVTPAAARTDILKQVTQAHIDFMVSKIPMGRMVEVEELGAMVAWLSSEDCSFSTGAAFDLSGGRAVY
jgi:2-dehydro-3-deoxy-L-rhamnonate dehydrogenase (NAD+)